MRVYMNEYSSYLLVIYSYHNASLMEDKNINVVLLLHSSWRIRHMYLSQDIHEPSKNIKIKL